MNPHSTFAAPPWPPSLRHVVFAAILMAAGGFATPAHAGGVSLLAAIRVSLRQNPDIRIGRLAVRSGHGAVLAAAGQFDPQVTASASQSFDNSPIGATTNNAALLEQFTNQTKSEQTSWNTGLSKQFTNGVTISAAASVQKTQNNIYSYYGYEPESRSLVGITILFPLLKGGGRTSVAATEDAADLRYKASVNSLRHQVASTILSTVTAYWAYRKAVATLGVLRHAERTTRRFVADIRKLIAADERPAADINPVLASLSSRTAARIAARQTVVDARQALGLVMGLNEGEIERLGAPSNPFPPPTAEARSLNPSDALINGALARRRDLKAARLTLAANRRLLVAAHLNTRDSLNFEIGAGYAGLQEGDAQFGSLVDHRADPNFAATLTYTRQLDNDAAKGAYIQQSAARDQALITMDTLIRTIRENVRSGAEAVRNAARQLKQSQMAVHLYRLTVRNEKKKLELGSSTLLDVITVQDELVNAEVANIAQQANYATAVAQLRYELGRLIAANGAVTTETLTAVPVRG